MPRSSFTIQLPPRFDLTRAVCSYGYFILAPNHWDSATHSLHRPLRGVSDRVVRTIIRQRANSDVLRIDADASLSAADRDAMRPQVARMLRLNEDPAIFAAWWKLNPKARRAGFARLFRSPTLFEDIVKTITGCNVTWPNTMNMNRLLCREVAPEDGGAFPTPAQLAAMRPDALKRKCRVGYRAGRIVELARKVAAGKLDLAAFEDASLTTDELFTRLRSIHGIGPYSASNLCQLMGRYNRVAIDTETYRHFRQAYGVKTPRNPLKLHKRIDRHYRQYEPFQFLQYWFELWGNYEDHMGPSHGWDADRDGKQFTAAVLK